MDHANLLRSLRGDANPGLKTVEKIVDYLGYEIKLVERKEAKPIKSDSKKMKGGEKAAIYKRGENWYVDFTFHGQRIREMIGPSR